LFQPNGAIDLSGHRFGSLAVLGPAGVRNTHRLWCVRCDCGRERIVEGGSLTRGAGGIRACRSCSRKVAARQVDHPLYSRWQGMKARCYYSSAIGYKFYGGRGITVDERWRGRGGFANFVTDMGAPAPGTTLDRIDNDRSYSSTNCRWAAPRPQRLNSRRVTWVTVSGVTQCVTDWARQLGVSRTSLISRAQWRENDYEAAIRLEPLVEPCFHPDSYGYRPGSYATQPAGSWKYKPREAGASK
jgi:hypothetical protein